MHRETYTVGGVRINVGAIDEAVENFFTLTSQRTGGYVCVASSHGIVDSQRDARLREIMNKAVAALPDGMPVAWVGRLVVGHTRIERVPGPEFFEKVLRDPRGASVRHFFYGSTQDVMDALLGRVASEAGPASIAGSYCPPFRDAGENESADVIYAIRKTDPSVIWVGLSTPKQEYWMANHHADFPGVLLVGVGAAFDFYAGAKSRGPKVLHRLGLEWFYRLVSEPYRLWRRYRYVVPRMLMIVAREAFDQRLRHGRGR